MYNGMEEIYVNAEARDGSDVSELMQVFTEGESYSKKFPVTSELKRLYREGDEKVIRTLSDELREEGFERGRKEGFEVGKNEGRVEGRVEGRAEGRTAILQQMLERGCSPEEVAELTGVPLEELQGLISD